MEESSDAELVSHLLKCAVALPSDSFLIAQHLMEVCRSIPSIGAASLKTVFRDSRLCCHCSTPWCFGQYDIAMSSNLSPEPVSNESKQVTQQSLVPRSYLALKCGVCTRTTRVPLKSARRPVTDNSVPSVYDPSVKSPAEHVKLCTKKRLRRQRTKNAGLIINPSASVQSTSKQHHQTNPGLDNVSLARRRSILKQAGEAASRTPSGLMAFLSEI